jgi:Tol biopolymer transport system component
MFRDYVLRSLGVSYCLVTGKHCLFTPRFVLAILLGLSLGSSKLVDAHDTSPSQSLGSIIRISVAQDGTEGNGYSWSPSISADGRYVVFESNADNLVENDTNYVNDIFLYEIGTGEIERVSISSQGTQSNGDSLAPAISADGRYIAFISTATNLVISDSNKTADTFAHDRLMGETIRVSVASDGTQGDGSSFMDSPSLSADGHYVSFGSYATNLVPEGDVNGAANPDIYVHDLQTYQTRRVSVTSDGIQGNDWSWKPSISYDGRFVAFGSRSSNLVENDVNASVDIFVHDLITGQTELISIGSLGQQGNADSQYPSISADGRYVAFASSASNLVAGDTNAKIDIYVHDRQAMHTIQITTAFDQTQSNDVSLHSAISGNGRFVFFDSIASNLVRNDTNNEMDLFLYDRLMGNILRGSTAFDGAEGNQNSRFPSISANGCMMTFASNANNLVSGDNNNNQDIFVRTLYCQLSFLPLFYR